MRSVFDFFVSYKQRDSATLAEKLADELKARKYDVWLDSTEIHPGESILASIETGMTSSIDALIVMSMNYFTGWSEQERRALFGLMTSQKLRIVPIWYGISHGDVQRLAPMFADIKAVSVTDDSEASIARVCDSISKSFRPEQRRNRLFEVFFRCLVPHFPADADIRLFLGVYDGDTDAVKLALAEGADVNTTDSALWNRYNRLALDCGCFPEWRKLFLYLSEIGAIGSKTDG